MLTVSRHKMNMDLPLVMVLHPIKESLTPMDRPAINQQDCPSVRKTKLSLC